jgi:hypothetical protein
MAEYETLKRIKESLIAFGFISGLCTNVEKTTIMRIGNRVCRWFRFAQLAKGKKFRP